jgi:hypothetical protein
VVRADGFVRAAREAVVVAPERVLPELRVLGSRRRQVLSGTRFTRLVFVLALLHEGE